jgi:hypothetical protein
LFWVFFLVTVSAYMMLSAGQAILDWLANSAVGYSVLDEKASGDEKTGDENPRTEC